MRRRVILRGCLAVLLGALTTVASAWLIAFFGGEGFVGSKSTRTVVTASALLTVEENAAPGRRARSIAWRDSIRATDTPSEAEARRAKWRDATTPGDPRNLMERLNPWGHLSEPNGRLQWAFGFPVPALWYERSGSYSPFGAGWELHGGIEYTKLLGRTRSGIVAEAALAYRVAWVGMLLDTSLFAGGWLVALRLAGRWRDRKRAGLCPGCAYSLAGLARGAACPECGLSGYAPGPSTPAGS
jgi:hypothetical protein